MTFETNVKTLIALQAQPLCNKRSMVMAARRMSLGLGYVLTREF
jgi:hypothetical protein